MASAKFRRSGRDLASDRLDVGRQVGQELVDGAHGVASRPSRPNQALGVGRCRDGDGVIARDGLAHRLDGGGMMRVALVEHADDDPGIEDRQRHSSLSPSSSPDRYAPVSLPACRATGSSSRTSSTRPRPRTTARSRSPLRRPAARIAWTGIVTWCFELTVVAPRRPCFTSEFIGKGYMTACEERSPDWAMVIGMSEPESTIRPLLRTRQVREFTDEPVDPAAIDAIADAARWSGSSQNKQPWRFIVVRDTERLRALGALGLPSTRSLATAAAAIAIVMPTETDRAISDAYDEARAAERMLVAASMLGLAAGLSWVPSSVRDEFGALLALPADRRVRTVIAIGHPTDAARRPKSPRGEARLPRNETVFSERWPD